MWEPPGCIALWQWLLTWRLPEAHGQPFPLVVLAGSGGNCVRHAHLEGCNSGATVKARRGCVNFDLPARRVTGSISASQLGVTVTGQATVRYSDILFWLLLEIWVFRNVNK